MFLGLKMHYIGVGDPSHKEHTSASETPPTKEFLCIAMDVGDEGRVAGDAQRSRGIKGMNSVTNTTHRERF